MAGAARWPGAGLAALAAAILAHQGVMLQAMPFVLLYSLWQWWPLAPARRGAGYGPAGSHCSGALLPYALAVGLAAFFVLPALAEARYVQIARGTGNGGMSYANSFLPLWELFTQPPLPVDPSLPRNPPVVRSLPVAALGLAALAWGRWLRAPAAHARRRRELAALSLLAVGALALMLPVARPVWDALPLLQLTLFPWRLLGPISLFVALLAGSGGRAVRWAIPPTERRLGWADGCAAGHHRRHHRRAAVRLPAAARGGARRPHAGRPGRVRDPAAPDFIGTTTVGEYLPVGVATLPHVAADRARLMAGEPVSRFDAPGAQVSYGYRPGQRRLCRDDR